MYIKDKKTMNNINKYYSLFFYLYLEL